MSFQDSIIITQPIDDSSVGVSEVDCIAQWDQDPLNETIVIRAHITDVSYTNARIHSTFNTFEDVLKRVVVILIKMYEPSDPSPEIERFLKRASLALMSMTISPSDLDSSFELNRQASSLPADGVSELIEAASEIQDFYAYADGESTTTVQTRAIGGRLTGRFERPDFPISLDDNS